jgi:hypothetical protein
MMPGTLVPIFRRHVPERAERAVTEWAWRDFAGVLDRADVVTGQGKRERHRYAHRGGDRCPTRH